MSESLSVLFTTVREYPEGLTAPRYSNPERIKDQIHQEMLMDFRKTLATLNDHFEDGCVVIGSLFRGAQRATIRRFVQDIPSTLIPMLSKVEKVKILTDESGRVYMHTYCGKEVSRAEFRGITAKGMGYLTNNITKLEFNEKMSSVRCYTKGAAYKGNV